MNTLLIYGATGYTGRMAARRAKDLGLAFEIAGRNRQALASLAEELGVGYRVFEASSGATQALDGVRVLLNFAGPFAHTAPALMQACIEAGVDYLDITAEITVYRLAERLGDLASEAGVMLMPGVGWDVVPTDSLAVRLARRTPDPRALRIALQVPGSMSRGSAMSVGEIVAAGVMARVDGELVATPDAAAQPFDFGDGPVLCEPLSFGDLVTAWHSTQIPDIAMYVHIAADAFPQGDLALLPDGPTAAEREAHRARAVVEVTAADGAVSRSVIETVNGYTFTPLSAIEAARRVLIGERQPGFETPARVFGSDFAECIEGTVISDD
ncbi:MULTISPECIES: trans-acting enoyl reductase family protein [unclassified Pseudomonas]|uniref:saccharopine dehydrogenase family protein n=1 Tax=unclassified Pseudomonas TaxID=196821 RepID=UPI00255735F9|nr:saccharopine dehydrogenase NADP-binding domain-containing protein [Pseudomonas sp. efr-133-TYG-103a]